ncbi:DUF1307 domain-containing protein [Enterococcus sp. LJL99]
MKKLITITLIPMLFFSLIACSKQSDKKKTEKADTQTFILEKEGVKSEAILTIEGEAIKKEAVIITSSFETAGVTTKQEAETLAENFKNQKSGIEGIEVSAKITDNEIILSSTTDYSKVDLTQLGIQKDMMAKDSNLPSAKVRIQDYKGMGYIEK